MKQRYITGLFPNEEAAGAAVRSLIEESFSPSEIGVLCATQAGAHPVELEHKTGAATGAAAGGVLGATLGGVGAALVAVGAVAAPGIGLVAAGPLVAALEGALAGAAGGGFLGTLAGLGFWEEDVSIPDRLKEGAILVGVTATGERKRAAERTLRKAGAQRIYSGDPQSLQPQQAASEKAL
ncbi:MAG: hypothetical protein HKP27_05395 [Myxococcales bacterium]|nr:hypothetical protein [Myxococcales bacterium]